ncbi:hypothetical protein NRY68_15790 [Acidithiobacillus ferrooxidans]|uniref:hypothetical protein n=1 Tax=Acidithiobacillus ferrooxidans TaxID=920 RepID=UPI002147F631|nr:hypothetical protein [Acidithiobacillus ferrooxidans]MCR1347214.1 hypothetical protein [Acidithiobacillus ferrooxidans]MCR1356039.1 hypothetical protein [Acidithiobacillus ferrooxidans]
MKRKNYQTYLCKHDPVKPRTNNMHIPSAMDTDSGIVSATPENSQKCSRPNGPDNSNNKSNTDYIWQVFNWCIGFSALASLEILASKYMENDWWLLFVVVVIAFTMFVSGAVLMFSILLPRFKSALTFSIIATILFLSYESAIFLLGAPLFIFLINHPPI